MRPNPTFASDDPDTVRRLVREHPFATLVSRGRDGLVASHYPILLEEDAEDLAIVSHVGRPDEEAHQLGAREAMLIVQGEHGYISPSWYPDEGLQVPTWNFLVAHLHGTPQILSEEENLATLTRLVDAFEGRLDHPRNLEDLAAARRVARGTVGYRMVITRFECKVKLSQNKPDATRRSVISALRRPGPYRQPALAQEMVRAWPASGEHD